MHILDWIDVGPVAAERDDNLASYFYDAGLSKRLVENPRQFLLLGRKGAGKTAVFRHFERRPTELLGPNDCLVALSLVNYSWRAHALLKNDEKAPTVSQRDSWRFVIAVESIRTLSETVAAAGEKPNSALKKAADLLERIFSKPVPSWTTLLGAKLFGLSKLKLPSAGADGVVSLGEVSFEQLSGDRTLQAELARNLDQLTRHLEDLLREACGERRVFLIFDRLDEAWDASSMEDCKRIITGLIHAADHYVTSFKGVIRPVVFLREDIYSDLDLNDKNKLKEDCGSTLMWDNESLEKMIKARITFFAQAKGQTAPSSLNALFDRKEMQNRSSPTNYILKRTFYRPRDVVAYMNKIIEHLKIERAELDAGEAEEPQTLNADAIYAAEPAFSEYLVNEIKDEWRTQLPDIDTYLMTFENIATTVFTADTFESEIRKKKPDLDRSAVRAIMRFLFDNSIIGIGVAAGATKQWRYKCVHTTQRYADADQFRVHFGLKRHLGLKDATGAAATEATASDD